MAERKIEYKYDKENDRHLMRYEGDDNWTVCNEEDLKKKDEVENGS